MINRMKLLVPTLLSMVAMAALVASPASAATCKVKAKSGIYAVCVNGSALESNESIATRLSSANSS